MKLTWSPAYNPKEHSERNAYYTLFYWPLDEDGLRARIGVAKVKGKYFISAMNTKHGPDVGPFKRLRDAKVACELCLALNEIPPSLKDYTRP